MSCTDSVRWGLIGTANIAARAFLPALQAAQGVPAMVGSRSTERGTAWAREHGVGRCGYYSDVLDADDVDAVYIALPNDQHVEWAGRAAAAGKAVLCEKPLGLTPASVTRLTEVAGRDAHIWEAFAFAFHPQTALIRSVIDGERLGECVQIDSEFHFRLSGPDNIRWSAERGGGTLFDVGCYPIRLARLIYGAEPIAASGHATKTGHEVDTEIAGVLDFPSERRLLFSAGFRRPASTFTRIIGTKAELRVSNPFHPTPADTVELWQDGSTLQSWPASDAHAGTAFEHAIRHIHAVLREDAEPQHTVGTDAVGQAVAIELIRATSTDLPGRKPAATDAHHQARS